MTTQVNANKVLLSLFFFAYTLLLFACARVPARSYDEMVSQWRSYDDVANWMGRYYSYDWKKFKNSLEIYAVENLPPVKTPRESFEEKSGLCFDAAHFAKETLNRIDPSYEAEIVFIQNRPYYKPNHYVCSFKKDGQLYIMDYGLPFKNLRGVFGPFPSLDQYLEFYLSHHPKVKRSKSISFGWPPFMKNVIEKNTSANN
jgi:hypothetical protein